MFGLFGGDAATRMIAAEVSTKLLHSHFGVHRRLFTRRAPNASFTIDIWYQIWDIFVNG